MIDETEIMKPERWELHGYDKIWENQTYWQVYAYWASLPLPDVIVTPVGYLVVQGITYDRIKA